MPPTKEIRIRSDRMKISLIGCGNMATAMIHGIISSKIVEPANICATAKTEATLERIQKECAIQTTRDNRKAAKDADILILAVKPQMFSLVLPEIADVISENCIVISIAAGKTISEIETLFDRNLKIVRAMPNTPALVLEGITAICRNSLVTDDEMKLVCNLLSSFGEVEEITETMMHAVIAVSGSSPAYIFMLIEAMADAAVAEGMPRKTAYHFAAQAVLGSAKMVLKTQKHPGELKDMVCSPAGTTIEAVKTLEKNGFRSAIMDAMHDCAEKSRTM